MFSFDNTYACLPKKFFAHTKPAQVNSPKILLFNHQLAQTLQIDIPNQQQSAVFSGQDILENSEPIALAYAGHQFGHFVPQLGDGRAVLLGEVIARTGERYDIQLKGAGRTPFSRGGDGLSPIGPAIREYIMSEAMHALGIPTTRGLAVVSTGKSVERRTTEPGAIFTRVASSHIRIGTFEYFAARGDYEAIKQLADYTINRHYPQAKQDQNPYISFFKQVVKAQTSLVTTWMSFGFIHGVMNTDNTSISGETIDYGPCAFMDNFNFQQVFSSIDHQSRYSYNNQLPVIIWNLTRLADCLVQLIDSNSQKAITILEEIITKAQTDAQFLYIQKIGKKIGLNTVTKDDELLIRSWLQYLQDQEYDYTLSFKELTKLIQSDLDVTFFKNTPSFTIFYKDWLQKIKNQDLQETVKQMNQVNPFFIPRNHQVERAIQNAIVDDISVFKEMNQVLTNPYCDQPEFEEYKKAPTSKEKITATFCGT